MNLPLYISRKLSVSPYGKKMSPAVMLAVAAVALSLAVMIFTVSTVLGFKKEISDRVIGFNSHITVYPVAMADDPASTIVTLTPSLKSIFDGQAYIASYYLDASMPAIMKTDSEFKGVYLKALGSRQDSSFVATNVIEGGIPDYSSGEEDDQIVVSAKTANELYLACGDKINTYFVSDDVRVRPLKVAAIYDSHFEDYDNLYVYASLRLIQKLNNLQVNQGASIQIYTDDFSQVEEYSNILQKRLMQAVSDEEIYTTYKVTNVMRQGASYFSWLSLLDTNVVVVIVLMMIVAAITLISGMLILIIEKIKFIGIMRSLGASGRTIRSIFIWMALKIGFIGMLAGNLLSIVLLSLQSECHFLKLDADSYYIDFVPVSLDLMAILTLNAGVAFVIWAVLVLPSRMASRISPAVTMRYE